MYNYREPPPLPSEEKLIQNGKQIGGFDIDILPDGDDLKIYSYWRGFRTTDYEKFPNHPVLNILKKIYTNLKPEEFIKKPNFREFFNDKSDKTIKQKIRSKNKYLKGTKFVAYMQLEIILKPYDFEKGDLFFRYNNYGFPENIPESFTDKKLYTLLLELNDSLKKDKIIE